MSLFSDATLAVDDDISAWESRMPSLAIKMGAFTGKRQLAKSFIAKTLIKRGIDPDTLTDATQLKDAAVFAELHLIFTDLADSPASIAAVKAKRYQELFDSEMELVLLKLIDGTSKAPSKISIPMYLA